MGQNFELGTDDGVPLWDLPDEYNRFRESIRHHPIILGRKSYDVVGSPLEDSLNIVVTRNKSYDAKGAIVAHSLEEALEKAGFGRDVFVIGGGDIFEMAIGVADRMELSLIDAVFPKAEAFFPKFSTNDWQLVHAEKHEKDERHAYSFTFQIWMRKEK